MSYLEIIDARLKEDGEKKYSHIEGINAQM